MAASKKAGPQPITAVQPLPSVVAELARKYPNTTWLSLPLDPSISERRRNINYRELNNAVDGMVDWVNATLGDHIKLGEMVAYMGINDMRYAVVEIALMKIGASALLPSPRNSEKGQEALFNSSGSRLLLYSAGMESHVDQVKSVLPKLQSFQIPEFDPLCDRGCQSGRLQPYQERSEHDPVVVLHTSGSTGQPKPIFHTNASIDTVRALREFAPADGRQNITDAFLRADESMLIVAPFFHIMGQTMLWRSLLCRASLVILPPQKPPSAELIIEAIKQMRPSLAFFPPSILEGIAEAPGGLEAVELLQSVYFAGGPLAPGVGKKLIGRTRLLNMHGSTETGICPSRVPVDEHDWQYFEIIPESGITMETDGSGLHEMVITKTHENERYQAIFCTHPEIRAWRTKDLFECHPKKKGLWLYKGRKDDLLVLSNGEKFNPVEFEKLVESHPKVRGALVIGQGRFQTALLIEPEWTMLPPNEDPLDLLDCLWPTIEQANATAPAHSKLWRTKIAFAKREKPFKRAPKGSIIRRQTVDLYEAEINALYSKEWIDDRKDRLAAHADIAVIKRFLRHFFQLKGFEALDAGADDHDIFSYGIDSLQIMELCHTVNRTFAGVTGVNMSVQDVYRHPTINSLAALVCGGVTPDLT